MSYSFGLTITPDTDLHAAVDLAFNGTGGYSVRLGQQQNGTETEAADAVEAVKIALLSLVTALGDSWDEANVSISGHANPGNVERSGWANDCVTVSLSVTKYSAPS